MTALPARSAVTMTMAGITITDFITMEIGRDLSQISGSFNVQVVDQRRVLAALYDIGNRTPQYPSRMIPGPVVTFAIDNELVLKGHLEKVRGKQGSASLGCTLSGRDCTGDLVESSALPDGPAEFRNITLVDFVTRVCAPYGIPVRTDVDTGAPFDRLSLHPHDTAMQAIDKAARQRSVLVVSDGVGGLLLTRGGATRGPGSILMGYNGVESDFDIDWSKRHSHYYVKGQTDQGRQRKGVPAHLDSSVVPLTADGTGVAPPRSVTTPAVSNTSRERQAIIMTGVAIDPEITRYRPTTKLIRTQSGMSSVQEQAEWALRVAKGRSNTETYTVPGWRTGPDQLLWRPNQLVTVYDPYAGIDGDLLIAGVSYLYGPEGERTKIRVVDRSAYDRVNEAATRRKRTVDRRKHGPLDSTVTPLSAS